VRTVGTIGGGTFRPPTDGVDTVGRILAAASTVGLKVHLGLGYPATSRIPAGMNSSTYYRTLAAINWGVAQTVWDLYGDKCVLTHFTHCHPILFTLHLDSPRCDQRRSVFEVFVSSMCDAEENTNRVFVAPSDDDCNIVEPRPCTVLMMCSPYDVSPYDVSPYDVQPL
jgi:hypothetical protein